MPVSLYTWINEADVILVVEVLSNFLGDSNESAEGKRVGDVVIEVVLVMLKLIHLFDGIVVVSHFWEGE